MMNTTFERISNFQCFPLGYMDNFRETSGLSFWRMAVLWYSRYSTIFAWYILSKENLVWIHRKETTLNKSAFKNHPDCSIQGPTIVRKSIISTWQWRLMVWAWLRLKDSPNLGDPRLTYWCLIMTVSPRHLPTSRQGLQINTPDLV